jgi:uncharacterized protein YdeI (YjbR/CyaY-like superfamily)
MPAAKSAIQPDSSPILFKSAKAFETWLKKNHATSDGLWLKIAKRGANEPSVTYPEAVEIALWIDGQKKGLDDHHFLQRFTPRRARSIWSKINVDKVAALIEAGRMQAPGYAQIEAAKADGRWAQAYDGARTSAVPEDLLAALEAEPRAKLNDQCGQSLRGAVAHTDGREGRDARHAHRPTGGEARVRRDNPHLQAQCQGMTVRFTRGLLGHTS